MDLIIVRCFDLYFALVYLLLITALDKDSNDLRFALMILGQIQVQVVLEFGTSVAFLTPSSFFIPKFEWVRLIIAAHPDKVS